MLEEALQPWKVFTLVRVYFGVGPLKVRLGQDRRRPVTGAGNIDRVQAIFVDQAFEMDGGEALPGVRAPVAQEAGYQGCASP